MASGFLKRFPLGMGILPYLALVPFYFSFIFNIPLIGRFHELAGQESLWLVAGVPVLLFQVIFVLLACLSLPCLLKSLVVTLVSSLAFYAQVNYQAMFDYSMAQNMHYNGYPRNTNPYTEKLGLVNFKGVASCGTATAVSVPCMFSNQTRASYDKAQARSQDDVLDIIQRAGVQVTWVDNDGGDKGVAKGVARIDIKPEVFPRPAPAGQLSG